MRSSNRPVKALYTEDEAAQVLGISVPRLHMILDENVFNDGTPRPQNVTLQASDLVLLSFWNRAMGNPKVMLMPKRS